MKLDVKGFAFTLGAIWTGCFLFTGLAHLAWPGYGGAFLDLASSIYPGYHPEAGFVGVIIGSLYALVDGAAAGAIIAWLYNRMTAAPGT